MTTTIDDPDCATSHHVARIVAAHNAAQHAIIELSNSIDRATHRCDDAADAVKLAILFGGPDDTEGCPTALIDDADGDRLLRRAADIRDQIKRFNDICFGFETTAQETQA